jgi:ABC-type antimicrobial peptide transport system permease subunit
LDPAAYAVTAILVSVIGLAAVAVPAYRATRIEPSDALRSE